MEYWYLCLIGLAAQALFIFLEKRKDYVKAVAFKALASLSFLGLGIASSALCSNSAFARLIVIGLALGVAGDALLNLRFVLDKAADRIFLAGIAAFLAGHVLYLAAQVSISSHLPAALAIGLAVAAGLLAWILRTVEAKRAFKVFGVAYIGAVVLMTAVAGGNIEGKGGLMFFIGAVLFAASDVVLIFNTFTKKQRFGLRVTNLMLYYTGQLLIALSLQLI